VYNDGRAGGACAEGSNSQPVSRYGSVAANGGSRLNVIGITNKTKKEKTNINIESKNTDSSR